MSISRPPWFAALLLAAAAAGCSAEGPWTRLASYNPLIRRQWTVDQRHSTTFYQRMEQMRRLESRASRLDEAEAAQTAQRMVSVVRDDTNPLVREQAVRILGELRHPSAEAGLNIAESDENSDVRQEVCRIRGRQRTRNGLRALSRMLGTDEDFDVRMAAARELANYRDPEAYQALGAVLADSDPALQHRAMASLQHASGESLGNDVGAWQEFVARGGPPPAAKSRWADLTPDWF